MVDNTNSYKDRVSRLISWGHWFMMANIMLAMLMAIRYVFAVDSDVTLLSTIYVLVTWIGHFGFLGIATYVIILFPITFIAPYSAIMRGVGAIIATMTIVALLIDGSVYQNYHLHLDLLAFDLSGFSLDNSIGWSSIGLFLLALLLVELTIANLIWKRLSSIRAKDVGNKVTLFFLGCFVLSHLMHIWSDAAVYRPILSVDKMFPLSHGSTARSLIKKYGWINEQHSQQLRQSNSARSINYPLGPLQCIDAPANNLLIITIASANSELVTEQLMPNLSKFAASSINATQHISSSLKMSDAKFSLQTGLPALYHDIFERRKLQSPLHSLSKGAAIKTFSIISDKAAAFKNDSAANIDQQHVSQLLSWINTDRQQPYYADITLYASQELSIGEDFTSHVSLPKQHLNAAEKVLATQYLTSLAYTDQLLGQILQGVNLSNTTVVITSNRGHDLRSIYQRSATYSHVNLRVPLYMSIPNVAPRTLIKQTSHYDIVPTLLRHHFKCGNPSSDISVGYDLLSTQQSKLIYVGGAKDFALYQHDNITLIDRQGQYRFYDKKYHTQHKGQLSFQALIDVMANINRFK